MKKSSRLLLFSFIFIVFTFSLIQAQPPFAQEVSFTEGYEIKIPSFSILKQNEDFKFSFHVYNISNGAPIDNSSTQCDFHLYNSSGIHLVEGNNFEHTTNHGAINEWEIDVLGGNFSNTDFYSYLVSCNSTILGGFESVNFEVTSTGLSPKSILNNSLMIVMLIVAILLIITGMAIKFPTIGFIGSILLILVGIYTMIYGLNDVVNLYTRAVALVEIGVGIIFMIVSAFEWLPWGKE